MAMRTKTQEYVFISDTTARTSGTRVDYAAITLSVAETTSRTFKSVIAEVTLRSNGSAGVLTSWLIGIKLGAVAFNDVTVTASDSSSMLSEYTLTFTRDVTAYFNANFGAGGTQTCQVGFTGTGWARINTCVKLIITYEFDDAAAATRTKTVKIPIESPLDALTTSLTEFGTNQVPALDTFLPEAGKVYRQIYFEFSGQASRSAATAGALSLALDAEAASNSGSMDAPASPQAHAPYFTYHWIRNDMTTNAVHAFKAASTNTALFAHPSVILVVVYDYDHSTTTTVINSVRRAMVNGICETTMAVAADKSRLQMKFFVEEPDTITLVQSGVHLLWANWNGATSGPSVACGSQANRDYSSPAIAVTNGYYDLIQRIDAGGAQGAGITLARGENTFTLDVYCAAAYASSVNAVLYLNYTSSVAAAGADAHAKTVIWQLFDAATNTSNSVASAAIALALADAKWYGDVAFHFEQCHGSSSTDVRASGAVLAEVLSGEGAGAGWTPVLVAVPQELNHGTGSNATCRRLVNKGRTPNVFSRHPTDPDTKRLATTTARRWRIADNSGPRLLTARAVVTYHSIPFTVSGSVTGFTGDGSGIAVGIHRSDTGELVQTAVTAVGGGYTATWYDDTISVYAEAQQDATHSGRSANGLAA